LLTQDRGMSLIENRDIMSINKDSGGKIRLEEKIINTDFKPFNVSFIDAPNATTGSNISWRQTDSRS